jgi:Icc protein
MKIIQLTDLHLAEAGVNPYEIDVRGNFIRALDTITAHHFDLLVISGDICYDVGQAPTYHWVRAELNARNIPYALIPGNHDDTNMMIDCFDLHHAAQAGQLFYTIIGDADECLIFLDSSSQSLSHLQLDFLRQQLLTYRQPVCLFIHHPPLPMGVPFMDTKHALRQPQPLLDILAAHPYPITVFSGHYHGEKSVRWRNVDAHITPSCFYQIDWKLADFAVDHTRIAYRHIVFEAEKLTHAVVYF